MNKPNHPSISSIGSSMYSPSSSSSNSSSSQSPNNSCTTHYDIPLFHSSPINQNLESTNQLSDTYSEPFDNLNKLISPDASCSEAKNGYSNRVIIKNVSKRMSQVNRASSPINSNNQQPRASNRLFYNFNNNNNFVISMPNTPAQKRPKNIAEQALIKSNRINRESR